MNVSAAGDSSYKSLAGQIKHMPAMPKPDSRNRFFMAAMLAFIKVGNAVTFPEGSMMNYYDSSIIWQTAPACLQSIEEYKSLF